MRRVRSGLYGLTICAAATAAIVGCFAWSTPADDAVSVADSGAGADGPTDASAMSDALTADVDASALDALVPDPGCSVNGSQCVIVLDGLTGPIKSLSASPDGTRIYWAETQTPGVVHLWNVVDGGPPATIPTGATATTALVAASETGAYFASTGADLIRFRDLTGTRTFAVTKNARQVSHLAWAPDPSFYLYWSESTTCWTCAYGGTPACDDGMDGGSFADPATCSGNVPITSIATLPDYAVWATATGKLVGHRFAPTTLDYVVPLGSSMAYAVGGAHGAAGSHDDEVFWGGPSSGTQGFLRRVFDGVYAGQMLVLDGRPASIVADATFVYWAEESLDTTSAFSIHRAPRRLDAPAELLASNIRGLAQLVNAGGTIYWTQSIPPATSGPWQLVRLPK